MLISQSVPVLRHGGGGLMQSLPRAAGKQGWGKSLGLCFSAPNLTGQVSAKVQFRLTQNTGCKVSSRNYSNSTEIKIPAVTEVPLYIWQRSKACGVVTLVQ